MAWVTHGLSSSECFLPDLLKCLRLFSMTKYGLRRILDTEELITKNLTCPAILNNGLDFFLFPDRFSDKLFKHRNSIEKEEYVITIIGGYEEGEYEFSKAVYCFALATNEWHLLSPLTNVPGFVGICSGLCGGRVYVLTSGNFTTISCFKPQKNTWRSIETEIPGQVFSGFTVISFRGDLYVSGGIILESEAASRNLHKYNPGCNEWKQLAPIEAGRFGHCAVVLEDLMYAIAGSDGEGEQRLHECLNSVECYNPFANQWRKVPDLNRARRLSSATSVGGKIVVVGGFCEMGDVTQAAISEPSCEMFDPCLNQWSLVSSPVVPRGGCGIVSVDGTVYVFGGEVGDTHLDSVECYDLKCNEWNKINTHMPVALSLADASLLKLPKHFFSSSKFTH